MKHWPITIAALALTAAGCSFDLEACITDADCPPDNVCARPVGTDVPMCLTTAEVTADADNDADASTVDAPDGSAPQRDTTPDDPSPGHCPSVTDCGEQEPNDTEDDAIYLTQFAEGCGSFSFEPWSVIHQDSACAGDVDQFVIEYKRCDRGAFRLTVTLTPPDLCAFGGDLSIAEGLYDCSDDNVRCESNDGVQRITIIVEDSFGPQPAEKIRFAVTPGDAPEGLQYILRATIDR